MITKTNINRAIRFFQKLKPESWCIEAQTFKCNVKNVGICHCAIGHLCVNPISPFYKKELLNGAGIECGEDAAFGIQLNYECYKMMGLYLAQVNNCRISVYQQDTPKERVIAFLLDFRKKFIELNP